MKRMLAMLLCVLLLLPVPGVLAAGGTTFLNTCEVTEDALCLYGRGLPQGGEITVSVDEQVISGVQLSTVSAEKIPVTVYCLVDITSDMTDKQVRQQTDVLSTISSRMGPEDSLVIAALGNTLTESQPLTTPEARETAIETLRRQGKTPKLFGAVLQAIETLETRTTYCANRCLVILADGYNDDDDGIQEEQVWKRIQESSVPVYGIAVVRQAGSSYAMKNAGTVVRMGQESVGGFGLDPVNGEISAAAAAESIWMGMQDGFVCSVPLDQISSRSNAASVNVCYETGDARFEDSMTVSLAGVPAVETEPVVEETQPEEEIPVEEESTSSLVLIGALVLGAAVIGAVVFVILRKRAKKQPEILPEEDMAVEEERNHVEYIEPEPETKPVFVAPTESPAYDVMVHFVAILHPDTVCSFGLSAHQAKTLGRSQAADVCLNNGDSKLSGKHCIVEWDGQNLYVQDIGSTNGTSLNGAPLKPNTWHRLDSGAKLRLGDYEYRVTTQVQ